MDSFSPFIDSPSNPHAYDLIRMELQLPPVIVGNNCKKAFSPSTITTTTTNFTTTCRTTSRCNSSILLKLPKHNHNYKKKNKKPLSSSSSYYSCCSSSMFAHSNRSTTTTTTTTTTTGCLLLSGLVAALLVFSSALSVSADEDATTLSNVPQTLSQDDKRQARRIQRPKSRKAESCLGKCVTTCIRGDEGEGPLNVRRPLVVFKAGFRSRQYCLIECSDICNLIRDGEDGP